jgi:hypothetical protein
LTLSSS